MSRARVSLTTCCLWETSYSTAPAQCMRLMLSHIRQPPPPLPPILLPLPNHTRLMPVTKALFFNERVSDFSPKFWATFEQLLSDVWTPYHSGILIFIFLKRLLLTLLGSSWTILAYATYSKCTITSPLLYLRNPIYTFFKNGQKLKNKAGYTAIK